MIKHLALVMDGNRRWAKKQGLQSWRGHNEGLETIKRVVQFCLDKKILYVSLYTFSLENFRRSAEELNYLFNVLAKQVEQQLEHYIKLQVRVRFLGDRDFFPSSLREIIANVEEKTKQFSILTVNFLFCYGARQEIIGGIKALVKKVQSGEMALESISDETFSEFLWTHGMPDPDLIIRTGGAKRLSNFLLYQAAYSEFYFFDCLWPEITEVHLQEATDSFLKTQRNFGT